MSEVRPGQCGHSGGQGIGAGHVCLCVRAKGHPLDSPRPHGCTCMALWADTKGVAAPTPAATEPAGQSALSVILDVMDRHSQSARNRRCGCGWRPTNDTIQNPSFLQHRNHLAVELIKAGLWLHD